MSSSRLYYIDNIRIFLTALVVLFHLITAYGAPGSWYYVESTAEFPLIIPMSMYIATNQAFFMGLFFLISSFFLLPSLNRKGTTRFVKERLIRLGIPLVVFYFLLAPITSFIRDKYIYDVNATILSYITNSDFWGFGPMWFVEALLLFTFLFFLVRLFVVNRKVKFPTTSKIILFALTIAILQFFLRIWIPVRWAIPHTNLRVAFFIQYAALFIIGIIAYQNHWFDSIGIKISWRWFVLAQVLVFVIFPLLYISGGGINQGEGKFLGGFYWQSFAYCLWEQFVAVSMIYGILGIFKEYSNRQTKLLKKLSDSAYGVYVFHTPLLLIISAVFLNWQIPQLSKFLALAPVSLLFAFFIAWLIKQMPGLKKVM